jgi:hypothetical protein
MLIHARYRLTILTSKYKQFYFYSYNLCGISLQIQCSGGGCVNHVLGQSFFSVPLSDCEMVCRGSELL